MAQDRKRYEDALRKGAVYLDNKLYKEAFAVYRAALKEFAKEPEPYAGLAEACFGLKRMDKALELYKMAARYSRGDIKYLKKVADVQERLGLLDAAGRTYMAVGEVYLRGRELDDAVSHWQRSIRLEPALLGPHRRLAMVYQRQNQIRDAVREYLAIARILQMQGDKKKAVQMCRAALRLDPDNEDVHKAFQLIKSGPEAFVEEEEEAVVEAAPTVEDDASDGLSGMVRQIATAFEDSRPKAAAAKSRVTDDPVDAARREAQNQLAEEIFRDEDGDEPVTKLSKLERDALIGQGMDFESRGQIDDAITCYKKAIDGGLSMPAAFYSLGMLYLDKGDKVSARPMLVAAAKDAAYREASKLAYNAA